MSQRALNSAGTSVNEIFPTVWILDREEIMSFICERSCSLLEARVSTNNAAASMLNPEGILPKFFFS